MGKQIIKLKSYKDKFEYLWEFINSGAWFTTHILYRKLLQKYSPKPLSPVSLHKTLNYIYKNTDLLQKTDKNSIAWKKSGYTPHGKYAYRINPIYLKINKQLKLDL